MMWETVGFKTSLLLLSIKIRERERKTQDMSCVYLLGWWDQRSVELFFAFIDFFLFWVRKYCWPSFLGEVKNIIGILERMPVFEATGLFKVLVGSFHHAYFKAGMISGISQNLKNSYSIVLLFTKLACLPSPYFGSRKNSATFDLMPMELKKYIPIFWDLSFCYTFITGVSGGLK